MNPRLVYAAGACAGLAAVLLLSFTARPQEAAGADTASVQVRTQAPQQGSLPETITAYGTAVPAVNGVLTLSVQAEGRVMRIIATPGEAVHAGQALLEFRLSAAAGSTYRQAISALKLAQLQQAHTARLLAQKLATGDQQAQADKAVSDAQAALDALDKENGGKAQQIITAPFDGVVSAIPVAQGDRVQPGAALATVTRSGGLVVTAGVEPAQRGRLKLGQPVHLLPLAAGDTELDGRVVRIDHVLNPKTRLIDADVAVSGEPLEGAAFRAEIQTGELRGWLVPRDAVLGDEQGDYLFQVAAGKARRVEVRRLGGDGRTSVVEGKLDPQQPLVIEGNYQLGDGMAVRSAEDKSEKADAPEDKTEAPAKKADAPAHETDDKAGS